MIRSRHDPATQGLHWLTAILVVAAFTMALVREELPRGELRTALLSLHMSLGLTVFGLTVVRLAWRPFAPRVAPLQMPPLMHIGATLGHLALYVALLAVPLSGLLSIWARGRGVDLFGLMVLPSPWTADRNLSHLFEEVHETAGNGMMVLAGLHAAAAIFHHIVLRDATLRRMLPFGGAGRAAA